MAFIRYTRVVSRKEYRSPLRERRAEETRHRILQAARERFEETGFAAATIDQIAERAGVSPATVYADFRSKAGIIAAMLEHLEERAGMDWRIPEMLEEGDPHRSLHLFVAGNRAVFESGHVVLRAAYDAIGTPEVRALMSAGDAHRRRGVDTMIERWHRAGALKSGLEPGRAAETMWLLTSVEQYLLATDVLGWSGDAYERWLRQLLDRALLQPSTTWGSHPADT